MNYYDPKQKNSISLLEHTKRMVLRLMEAADDDESARSSNDPNHPSFSTESESDLSQYKARRRDYFKEVIDSYLDAGGQTSFQKVLQRFERSEHLEKIENEHEKFARIYLELERKLKALSLTLKKSDKIQKYNARLIFARIAHFALRNSNSSSILERAFNDCLRSVSDRRVKLRKIFKNRYHIKMFFCCFRSSFSQYLFLLSDYFFEFR